MGLPPEDSLRDAATGSPPPAHFPCLGEGERPREPIHLPNSGKSGLAKRSATLTAGALLFLLLQELALEQEAIFVRGMALAH